MTVFFILLVILIVVIVILTLSSLKINVEIFRVINKKILDIKIVISIAFLNKINILKITLDKNKLKKIEYNDKIQKITQKMQEKLINKYKYENDFGKESLKEILKILKYIKLSDTEIDVKVGTESAAFTSFLVMLISMAITFGIARKVQNTRYSVLPVYKDKVYFKLSTKCIISIKLVHIISIIKQFKRKDRKEKNGRTLNRRTYANSNG